MPSKRKRKGPGRPPAGKRGAHVSRDYKAMTVRMPPGIKRTVTAEAKRLNQSISAVIVQRVADAANEAAARKRAEAEAAAQQAALKVFTEHVALVEREVNAHRERLLAEHDSGRIDADEMARQLRTLMTNFRNEMHAAQEAYRAALETARATALRLVNENEGTDDGRSAAG